MKTVIEMAREAGAHPSHNPELYDIWSISDKALERFAELVRADEREKYKWDVHSCGPTCTKVACMAMREAVKAEREAIAKWLKDEKDAPYWSELVRARGQA